MDKMTAAHRSQLMSRIRSKDTQPELLLRRRLHAAGYRFRLHGALPIRQLAILRAEHQTIRFRGGKLPGSPDLVFSARCKVIFVNGCFWHGHDCPAGNHRPASNRKFWSAKLDANIARDERNRQDLNALGWDVMTIWECQLHSIEDVLLRVKEFLGPLRYNRHS